MKRSSTGPAVAAVLLVAAVALPLADAMNAASIPALSAYSEIPVTDQVLATTSSIAVADASRDRTTEAVAVHIPKALFATPVVHAGTVTVVAAVTGPSSLGRIRVRLGRAECDAFIRAGLPARCSLAFTGEHAVLVARAEGPDFAIVQSWRL